MDGIVILRYPVWHPATGRKLPSPIALTGGPSKNADMWSFSCALNVPACTLYCIVAFHRTVVSYLCHCDDKPVNTNREQTNKHVISTILSTPMSIRKQEQKWHSRLYQHQSASRSQELKCQTTILSRSCIGRTFGNLLSMLTFYLNTIRNYSQGAIKRGIAGIEEIE
jgi:hypothetical protein